MILKVVHNKLPMLMFADNITPVKWVNLPSKARRELIKIKRDVTIDDKDLVIGTSITVVAVSHP